MRDFTHEPVMVAEVVGAFAPVPAGLLVDGTVGGGGHAGALLRARPDSVVLGLDRDAEAVAAAGERLSGYGARVKVRRAGFEDLAGVLASAEVAALGLPVVGVLFDLGVSSWQLDEPGRGFAYRVDAPLDMRMDQSQESTARDVVNGYEEAELARVIARYGEERFAGWSSRPPVPRGLPVTGTPGDPPPARLVTKGAARPSPDEVAANPRAESARFRVLERV